MAKEACKGTTKSGKPCRAPAGESGLCFFHEHPEKAKALGQKGGQRNRKFGGFEIEVPEKMTLPELPDFTTRVMRALASGELQPRPASVIAQLLSLQHRFLAAADLEARVRKLEQQSE